MTSSLLLGFLPLKGTPPRTLTLHLGTHLRVTHKLILHKAKGTLPKGIRPSSLAMLPSMVSLSNRSRALVSWKDAWRCFAVVALWMLAFEGKIFNPARSCDHDISYFSYVYKI